MRTLIILLVMALLIMGFSGSLSYARPTWAEYEIIADTIPPGMGTTADWSLPMTSGYYPQENLGQGYAMIGLYEEDVYSRVWCCCQTMNGMCCNWAMLCPGYIAGCMCSP